MDLKLEVIVLPVADVDRAKQFYKSLGWRLDADVPTGPDFRVVQLTPPGSPCSIIFGAGVAEADVTPVTGLHLVVADIGAARTELQKAGVDVILTQTPRHANTAEKIRAWRLMNPDESGGGNPDGVLGQALKLEGAPHPFANKDAVARYFKVLSECYQANLAWRMGS